MLRRKEEKWIRLGQDRLIGLIGGGFRLTGWTADKRADKRAGKRARWCFQSNVTTDAFEELKQLFRLPRTKRAVSKTVFEFDSSFPSKSDAFRIFWKWSEWQECIDRTRSIISGYQMDLKNAFACYSGVSEYVCVNMCQNRKSILFRMTHIPFPGIKTKFMVSLAFCIFRKLEHPKNWKHQSYIFFWCKTPQRIRIRVLWRCLNVKNFKAKNREAKVNGVEHTCRGCRLQTLSAWNWSSLSHRSRNRFLISNIHECARPGSRILMKSFRLNARMAFVWCSNISLSGDFKWYQIVVNWIAFSQTICCQWSPTMHESSWLIWSAFFSDSQFQTQRKCLLRSILKLQLKIESLPFQRV